MHKGLAESFFYTAHKANVWQVKSSFHLLSLRPWFWLLVLIKKNIGYIGIDQLGGRKMSAQAQKSLASRG